MFPKLQYLTNDLAAGLNQSVHLGVNKPTAFIAMSISVAPFSLAP
jgi:hypothetical protein